RGVGESTAFGVRRVGKRGIATAVGAFEAEIWIVNARFVAQDRVTAGDDQTGRHNEELRPESSSVHHQIPPTVIPPAPRSSSGVARRRAVPTFPSLPVLGAVKNTTAPPATAAAPTTNDTVEIVPARSASSRRETPIGSQ